MKQTNKSCRLAPLCHLPRNKPFHFMCFLKSRGEEQLGFHKTARGLGLQSQLQWVPSYLSATAGCQQELFQAPLCSRMHPRLMFGGVFCGWQWLCRWRSELSWNGCAKWAMEEKWGSGWMGKRLNLERIEKGSGMKQVDNVAASAFFFQSLILFFYWFPCLSWFFTLCLLTFYSHVFFSFSVFPSGSGALIWEVKLVCHDVNW